MNELGIIDLIRKTFKDQQADLLDDVAFIKMGGRYLVLKTDMFVGKTDLPPGMSLRQASRKAVVACVSDLLCKGAEMWGFMVSLGIPRSMATREGMRQVSLGLLDASLEYEVPILGGDVNESDDLVMDVALVGSTKRMVRRNGPRPGDSLVATGPFGLTGLGLNHLLKDGPLPRSLAKASLASVYLPRPRNGLCKALIEKGFVDASMDSSDGLAVTLNEMSKQSGLEFLMTSLPAEGSFLRGCSASHLDAADLILHGGEEYEAVLAVPKRSLRAAVTLADQLGAKLYPFGQVGTGRPRVLFKAREGGRPTVVAPRGWVHLQQPTEA